VASVAAVLLRQRPATRHPRRIAGVGRRCGLRHPGDEVGEATQIVVGQRLRHLVHRLEGAQLLAKHEELDQRVRRLLAPERGRVFGLGRTALAVTGKTGRDAIPERFCICRASDQGERQRRYCLTHLLFRGLSSFRGDAKHRTRNLEIPGLVLRPE
jgi:hypothetical protein